MLRNTLISLLLMIALSLSAWSIFLSSQSRPIIKEITSNKPDVFMENVSATIMSKLGKPVLKIETPKIIHYLENDVTELTTPHVTVYRDSPEPWQIYANHARAKQGISEITFWDHVTIHHLADSDNPDTTIRTAALTLIPEQQIAKTNEAITVTQPDTTVQAIGMLANWDQGTVKLLSNAREEYVPKS